MDYMKSKNNDGLPKLVIFLIMLLGIGLIVWGVNENLNIKEKTKYYASTEGKFIGATVYSDDSDGSTTYSLTYAYKVNGNEYKVTTNYGTSNVPKIGSTETIKYNPANPNEANIMDGGGSTLLILLG